MNDLFHLLLPVPADDRKKAMDAVNQTAAIIRKDKKLVELIRAIAMDQADLLIDRVARGEYFWRIDERFRQPKEERDKSVERVAAAAAELAAALRETTWPWLKNQAIAPSHGGELVALSDHLDWMASFASRQPIDFADRYPPAQSKTSYRDFMLRHIKSVVRDVLKNRRRLDILAAAIARAVLDDPGIDEETIKKK